MKDKISKPGFTIRIIKILVTSLLIVTLYVTFSIIRAIESARFFKRN